MRDISTYEHPAIGLALPVEVEVPANFDVDGRIDDLLHGDGLFEYFADGDVWDWENARRNIAAIFTIVAFETRNLALAFTVARDIFAIIWDSAHDSDEGQVYFDEMVRAYDWLLGARTAVVSPWRD
jgi:hypothetical protein